MTFKVSRSTSFFTVDAGQSLDDLLRTTRRKKKKFVLVNVDHGLELPSSYLAEYKNFVDVLEQLKKQIEALKVGSKIPSANLTLQDFLRQKRDKPKEVATTEEPLTRLSERTRSMIQAGNVVVHLRKNRPATILLPSTITFDKLSSRGWLDLNRLSNMQSFDFVRVAEEEGADEAGETTAQEEEVEGVAEKPAEESTQHEVEEREESPAPAAPASAPSGTARPTHAKPPDKTPPHAAKANGGGPPRGGEGDGNGGGRAGDGNGGGSGPSGDMPAYPHIAISKDHEHPVQSTTIDVEVSIRFEKPEQTTGVINLPSDNRLYILDVHLLLGKESRWEKLKFQRPQGTIEPAVFKAVKVPSLPVAARYNDDRFPCDIYVNFYLLAPNPEADTTPVRNARWCGEAVRRIEVLPRPGMATTPIEPPETVEWRKYLYVSPTSPPPDLLVRIKKLGELDFQWTVLSPHQDFTRIPAQDLSCKLTTAPYAFMQEHFEHFAGKQLDDKELRNLNVSCELIYGATPEGFRKAYWDLRLGTGQDPKRRAPLETIQFISDEPYIPWELMRVADDKRAPNQEPEILALRHAVGRWIAPDSLELRQWLSVSEIAVFATDYANVDRVETKLTWALDERKDLVKNYRADAHKVVEADVDKFLLTGKAQVVHFSCHGRMNVELPDQAVIDLEDSELLATTVWSTEIRRGIGRHRPLVFLNACQTGATGELLGFVFGWPQAFLRMGATACIAPLWSVIDESAKDAAKDFYKLVLKGDPNTGGKPATLGEALRIIRSRWKEKRSLTYLGYILYGDPTATLNWH